MPLFLGIKVENWCIGTAKIVILTSDILDVIPQPLYSHYIDLVSYKVSNNFENMPLLVALLMNLLTTGELARHVIHGIFGCSITSVAKVPER